MRKKVNKPGGPVPSGCGEQGQGKQFSRFPRAGGWRIRTSAERLLFLCGKFAAENGGTADVPRNNGRWSVMMAISD